MTEFFGRKPRNGALIRGNEGLPEMFELYPADIPIKPSPSGQDFSNYDFYEDVGIKPSPSYDQVNAPKGLPEAPVPIPKKIVIQTVETDELVVIA